MGGGGGGGGGGGYIVCVIMTYWVGKLISDSPLTFCKTYYFSLCKKRVFNSYFSSILLYFEFLLSMNAKPKFDISLNAVSFNPRHRINGRNEF